MLNIHKHLLTTAMLIGLVITMLTSLYATTPSSYSLMNETNNKQYGIDILATTVYSKETTYTLTTEACSVYPDTPTNRGFPVYYISSVDKEGCYTYINVYILSFFVDWLLFTVIIGLILLIIRKIKA